MTDCYAIHNRKDEIFGVAIDALDCEAFYSFFKTRQDLGCATDLRWERHVKRAIRTARKEAMDHLVIVPEIIYTKKDPGTRCGEDYLSPVSRYLRDQKRGPPIILAAEFEDERQKVEWKVPYRRYPCLPLEQFFLDLVNSKLVLCACQ
jgi:hypothetical protein